MCGKYVIIRPVFALLKSLYFINPHLNPVSGIWLRQCFKGSSSLLNCLPGLFLCIFSASLRDSFRVVVSTDRSVTGQGVSSHRSWFLCHLPGFAAFLALELKHDWGLDVIPGEVTFSICLEIAQPVCSGHCCQLSPFPCSTCKGIFLVSYYPVSTLASVNIQKPLWRCEPDSFSSPKQWLYVLMLAWVCPYSLSGILPSPRVLQSAGHFASHFQTAILS